MNAQMFSVLLANQIAIMEILLSNSDMPPDVVVAFMRMNDKNREILARTLKP